MKTLLAFAQAKSHHGHGHSFVVNNTLAVNWRTLPMRGFVSVSSFGEGMFPAFSSSMTPSLTCVASSHPFHLPLSFSLIFFQMSTNAIFASKNGIQYRPDEETCFGRWETSASPSSIAPRSVPRSISPHQRATTPTSPDALRALELAGSRWETRVSSETLPSLPKRLPYR